MKKSTGVEWTLPLTENPTDEVWKAIWTWATRLAILVAKGEYLQPFWQDELTSAGCRQVFRAWPRYWRLPTNEWVKVMTVVMVFAMLAVIRKNKTWMSFLNGPETDPDSYTCMPKHHATNEDLIEQISTRSEPLTLYSVANVVMSDEMAAAETRADLETIWAAARRVLTKADYDVLQEVMRFQGLTGDEMAARIERTDISFRVHKSGGLKKLGQHFREP
jgi:hypothetical protein